MRKFIENFREYMWEGLFREKNSKKHKQFIILQQEKFLKMLKKNNSTFQI